MLVHLSIQICFGLAIHARMPDAACQVLIARVRRMALWRTFVRVTPLDTACCTSPLSPFFSIENFLQRYPSLEEDTFQRIKDDRPVSSNGSVLLRPQLL